MRLPNWIRCPWLIGRGIVCFSFFIFHFPLALQAQTYPQFRWQRMVGTPADDVPVALGQGPDSTLAILSRGEADPQQGLLVCVDLRSGTPRWQRPFLTNPAMVPVALAASDTAIWLAGQGRRAMDQISLRRYNWQGRLLGTGIVPVVGRIAGFQVRQAQWFVLTERTDSSGQSQAELWSGGGGQLPQRLHRWPGVPLGLALAADGIWVWGRTAPLPEPGRVLVPPSYWAARTDASGNLQGYWQLLVPGNVTITAGTSCADGGLALAGARSEEGKRWQYWLGRMDNRANFRWQRTWGSFGNEVLQALQEMPDGGFSLAGGTAYTTWEHPQFKGGQDVWLLRTDRLGHLLWQRSLGGPEDELPVAVAARGSSHWLLARKRNTFQKPVQRQDWDAWLVHLREQSCGALEAKAGLDIARDTFAVNEIVPLANLSTVADASNAVWRWDFGDGTYSSERQPRKRYPQPGQYRIILTVQLGERCSSRFILPQLIEIR